MRFSPFRRLLAWSVTAGLLLPIALTLVLGLGSLLAALGDSAAATACGRLALALGVAWLTAVVATTLTSGLVALGSDTAAERGPRSHPRRLARRRRRAGFRRTGRMRDRPPDDGSTEPGETFGGDR